MNYHSPNYTPADVKQWFESRTESAVRSWSGIALDGKSQRITVWQPHGAEAMSEAQVLNRSCALSIFCDPHIQALPKQPVRQPGDISGAFEFTELTLCWRAVLTIGHLVPFLPQFIHDLAIHDLELARVITDEINYEFSGAVSAADSEVLEGRKSHSMVACLGSADLDCTKDVGESFAFEIWLQVPKDDYDYFLGTQVANLRSHTERARAAHEVQVLSTLRTAEFMDKFTNHSATPGDSNEPH